MEIISIIGILIALAIVVMGFFEGPEPDHPVQRCGFCRRSNRRRGTDQRLYHLSGRRCKLHHLYVPHFPGRAAAGLLPGSNGLTESIANAIIKKFGTKMIVIAVFLVSWILVFCGINVFVIIFTVYPLACAFFKVGDIPRSLIPACVLGACVSEQVLPGVTTTANLLSTEAFGVPAAAGPLPASASPYSCWLPNGFYLYRQGEIARKERGALHAAAR